MNRLIVNVVAVNREQNEVPTTAIKLESSAKLGFNKNKNKKNDKKNDVGNVI